MKNISLARVGRYVGLASVGMMGVSGLMMLLPIAQQGSFALCTPDSSVSECMSMPINTEVGVTTNTVISLALDNQVQIAVTPRSTGTVSYASTKLSVSTNSNDGYALYLQTGSESGSEVELNSNNTDITGVWKGAKKTEREIPAKSTPNYANIASWDLGDIVLTNPTDSSLCSTPLPEDLKAQGYTDDALNSVWYNHSSLTENCSQWYKNVNDLVVGYNATETSSISPDGKSYDAHYLIGNYYSWNAATAGSGALTNTANSGNNAANTDASKLVDATDSICSKGWKLPTSGRYYNSDISNMSYPFEREGSFTNLLKAYGYPEGKEGAGWTTNSMRPVTSITGTGRTRLDFAPMYFVRSGYIIPNDGALRYAGYGGLYWSNTAAPNTSLNTYDLYFFTTSVFPADASRRYDGLPIRCLAR